MGNSAKQEDSINNMVTDVAVLVEKIGTIGIEVKDIKRKLEGEYVTRDQFEPVKNIVYGMVGVILLAVIGALVGIVIIK